MSKITIVGDTKAGLRKESQAQGMTESEIKLIADALRVFQLYRKKGAQPETAMDRRLQKAKAITEKYLSN